MGDLTKARTAEIGKLHGEIIGHLKTSLQKAIRIGELLSEQKENLKHSEYGPWVTANLPFTDRTARNYMRCYRERDRLKTATVADLKSAYKLLALPDRVHSPNFKSDDDEEWFYLGADCNFEETNDIKMRINETVNHPDWTISLNTSDWYKRFYEKKKNYPPFEKLYDDEQLFWHQLDIFIFLLCAQCFISHDGKDVPPGLIVLFDELIECED